MGRNVFAHESGIHVNAMLRDTSTFEPFPAEEVGGERLYVLGKHSGRALVASLLTEAGRQPTADELADCLARVRELSSRRGGPVEPAELLEIHDEVRASLAAAPSA